MIKKNVHNEIETKNIARKLGEILQVGDCLVLTGDLGAGKTTFTKGLAEGLGIEQLIKSPTYTIVKEYQNGRLPLYHMDVYRLAEGATDLGLDDYFYGDGVCVIEWGQNIAEELPESYMEITIQRTELEDERELSFIAVGEMGETLVNKMKNI